MDRVPILSLGEVLLVSIQIDLQDDTVLALQEDLAERIVSTGARGVAIDISAVDIVDSFIGRMFASIASLSRLLDAETVVVGMRPAVAITLVELGLSLDGVRTALNLEKGLQTLRRLTAQRDLPVMGEYAELERHEAVDGSATPSAAPTP
jgi:rsbT antagonist protein RsbS